MVYALENVHSRTCAMLYTDIYTQNDLVYAAKTHCPSGSQQPTAGIHKRFHVCEQWSTEYNSTQFAGSACHKHC